MTVRTHCMQSASRAALAVPDLEATHHSPDICQESGSVASSAAPNNPSGMQSKQQASPASPEQVNAFACTKCCFKAPCLFLQLQCLQSARALNWPLCQVAFAAHLPAQHAAFNQSLHCFRTVNLRGHQPGHSVRLPLQHFGMENCQADGSSTASCTIMPNCIITGDTCSCCRLPDFKGCHCTLTF